MPIKPTTKTTSKISSKGTTIKSRPIDWEYSFLNSVQEEKPKSKANDDMVTYRGNSFKKSECVKISEESARFCGGWEYAPMSKCVQMKDGTYILRDIATAIITHINKNDHSDITIEYKDVYNIKYNGLVQFKSIWATSYDSDVSLRSKINRIYEQGIRGVFFENIEVLLNCGYVEDLISGTIMLKEHLSLLEKSGKRDLADYQKFHNPVENTDHKLSKTELIEYGIESPTFIKTEGKQYTWGLEFETIRGVVPEYIRHQYNMCAKFDGSLRLEDGNAHGAEYITGVLKGDAGLVHIYKIVNELSKRCAINKLCSVHVHVGGVDFNQEFIVYMYKLGLYIEQELFDMMPISRSKSEYCQKMKKISFDLRDDSNHEIDVKNGFELIRKIINVIDTKEGYKVSKKKDHPMGHCCGYKRDTPRYWWLNFVPAMYNIRGNESYTMEFRIHSATLNYKKVENWILICLGIVNFVENHKRMIKPGITLRQIMTTVYPKNGNRLSDYIDKRKSIFTNSGSATENVEYGASENISDEHLKTKKQILTS